MKKIGIYNPYLDTKGGGEKVCLALAESLAKYPDKKVYLITHSDVDLVSLANYFKINLDNVHTYRISFDSLLIKIISRLPLTGRIRNLLYDIKAIRAIKRANFDVFINNCYQSSLPNPSKYGVYMCMFPQKIHQKDVHGFAKSIYLFLVNKLSRLILHSTKKHAVYTYDLVTANSAYTQSYIKNYWGLDSQVLYPIGEDMLDSTTQKKEKMILNVGRFFENIGESHNKRQDFLLETFKKMPELYQNGWQLHFAGSVAEDVGALKYILGLMKENTGLPVYFHFNCSFQELKELYNKSAIYWHATGYGSDPKEHPEKQEHFGITTVEAMSAKCVPVVIDSAGQKESVIQGKNGYLWKTQKDLMKRTLELAEHDNKLENIGENARRGFQRFNKQAFEELVAKIFSEVL